MTAVYTKCKEEEATEKSASGEGTSHEASERRKLKGLAGSRQVEKRDGHSVQN